VKWTTEQWKGVIFSDESKFTNYRPISVLSNISKLLEKCMHARLMDFLNINSVISERQYGFRKNRNTEMALRDLTSQIHQALDKDLNCSVIFLDTKKAFDSVPHDLLIDKLECYGIRGLMQEWLSSYITNRQQSVRIKSVISDKRRVITGVPQGSTLGPLLFVLFINDFCKLKLNSTPYLFADDVALCFVENDPSILFTKNECRYENSFIVVQK